MMLGGPLGAVAGVAAGHCLMDEPAGAATRLTSDEEREALFFTCVFGSLGKMAKADGLVTQDEVDFVDHFIRNELRLSASSREFAIEVFRRSKDDDASIHDYIRQFAFNFHERDMRIMLYSILFTVAVSDGELHREEEKILREIPSTLSLPNDIFEHMKRQYFHQAGKANMSSADDLVPAYECLGIEAAATDSEVKKAYRSKCQEYHPDTLHSRGLPDEFMNFAAAKMQEVNEAYEKITKARKAAAKV